jgi:hypothetical protein
MVQLLLPLVLNIALLLETADRRGLTIFTETEQDRKLDIHLYNNIEILQGDCTYIGLLQNCIGICRLIKMPKTVNNGENYNLYPKLGLNCGYFNIYLLDFS